MEKQEKTDRLLFSLFISLALASAWASLNYFQSSSHKDQSLVAKTISTSNIVKRKSKGDLFFHPIATHSDLYLRDHITTGVGSNVEIEFLDGGRLFLREMSHVILDNKHQSTNIEIEFGRIQVQLEKNKTILIDGERTIKSTSEKSVLQYSKSGKESEIILIEGELEIKQGSEKKNIDQKNPSGYWSEEGAFYELKTIDILEPRQNQNIEVDGNSIIAKWVSTEGIDKYSINLYQEQEFLQTTESNSPLAELRIIESGNYEILIEGLKDNRVIARSPMLAFKATKFIRMTPLSPIDQTLDSEDPDRAFVQFEWEKVEDQGLRIEVEQQKGDLWEFFATSDVEAGESSKNLEIVPGRFRWRISPLKGQDLKYKESDWKEFSVVEKIWPLIKPPRLQKIERPWRAEDSKGLRLVWDRTEEDFAYEIQIGSKTYKAESPNFTFLAPKPLATKYRVRVLNRNGRPGSWSEFQTLHLQQEKPISKEEMPVTTTTSPTIPAVTQVPARIQKPLIPINNVPIPVINVPKDGVSIKPDPETEQIPIQLSKIKDCDSYEIEIDDSPKFFAATILKEKDENIVAKVSQGKKYMRARCWKEGKFGTWTHPISFEVQ
jgi:hypothetical protein